MCIHQNYQNSYPEKKKKKHRIKSSRVSTCHSTRFFFRRKPTNFQVLQGTSQQILTEIITRTSASWNLIVNSFFYDFLSFKRLYIPLKSTKLSFKRWYLNAEGI